jgi:capsular exopolysaccharide synthesis family protein
MLQALATEKPNVRVKSSVARRYLLSAHYEALLRQIQYKASNTSQAIGVISCAPGAGVSTIALNVAVTAARSDCGPVLFIDADTSKLLAANVLKEKPSLGLADALAGNADPLDCVESSLIENLSIIAGRGTSQQDQSPIESSRFAQLLDDYKQEFNLLVIDIPAATELNGSAYLAGQLDGVVLVLEAERADGRAALQTKQQLIEAGATLLGVVLNKRRHYVPDWLYRRV